MNQNKTMIINLDNMHNLGIDAEYDDETAVYVSNGKNYPEDYYTVAVYKTYDRAKGIIQDIIRRADVGARTFIMPEE